MRKPLYLSPSALAMYESDAERYYLNYLSDNRPERDLQTPAMAIGSAFDAYIKSYLHDKVYGKNHKETATYELRVLFESQVDKHLWNEIWPIGAYLFAQYKASGALSDLMLEIQDAVDEPRFEFKVQGVINGVREGVESKRMGVPLLGKPDIRFVNAKGAHVIFDWKVNGWFARGNTSPMAGYVKCREQQGQYWNQGTKHKDAYLMNCNGITINAAGTIDEWNKEWATQLATYNWLLGAEVGVEDIVGVDQIVCHGGNRDERGYPNLRIASHRAKIASSFQHKALARYMHLWGLITDEPCHFFREMSFADSKARCELLDGRSALFSDPTLSDVERWALMVAKPKY